MLTQFKTFYCFFLIILSVNCLAQKLISSDSLIRRFEKGDINQLYSCCTSEDFKRKYSDQYFMELANDIHTIFSEGYVDLDYFNSRFFRPNKSWSYINGKSVNTTTYPLLPTYLFNSFSSQINKMISPLETIYLGLSLSTLNSEDSILIDDISLIDKSNFEISTYLNVAKEVLNDSTTEIGCWFNEGTLKTTTLNIKDSGFDKIHSKIIKLLQNKNITATSLRVIPIDFSSPSIGISITTSFSQEEFFKTTEWFGDLQKSLFKGSVPKNKVVTRFELVMNYSKNYSDHFYLFADGEYGIFKSDKTKNITKWVLDTYTSVE